MKPPAARIAAICLALPVVLASADARAQAQTQATRGDAVEKLRTCSVLADAERLACLEKLSRDIRAPSANPASNPSPGAATSSNPAPLPAPAPAPQAPPAADKWIVSETTSPLDYSPVAVATASTDSMRLSIQCRGGRTELVIVSAALTLRVEEYVVSYDLKDGKPVTLVAGTPASGAGVGIRGDVPRLLASLPDGGEVAFRVTSRQGEGRGAAIEGRYALPAMKAVLKQLAGPCKWPAAGAPRN
jgi:hypothetical protein